MGEYVGLPSSAAAGGPAVPALLPPFSLLLCLAPWPTGWKAAPILCCISESQETDRLHPPGRSSGVRGVLGQGLK